VLQKPFSDSPVLYTEFSSITDDISSRSILQLQQPNSGDQSQLDGDQGVTNAARKSKSRAGQTRRTHKQRVAPAKISRRQSKIRVTV